MARRIQIMPLSESQVVEQLDCHKIIPEVKDMDIIQLGQQEKVRRRICSEAIAEASRYFQLSPLEESVSELNDLLFYKLVQGGNVAAIMAIFDRIQNDHPLLYRCLLEGRKPEQELTATCEVQPSTCIWKIINTLICLFLILPLFLIAAPFIYVILYIGNSRSFECCKAENIKLPLLFTTISNSVSMVDIFKDRYQNILKATDDFSNNIFHLIAIISQKDIKIALRCFRMILQTFKISEVKDVLLNMRNDSGLNGLEYAVKVGSPLYFTEILETEGILKTTVLAISKGNIYECRKLEDKSGSESVAYRPNSSELYSIAHYDVSRYEKGDVFLDQSFLLTLFSDRELISMTDEEVDSIGNNLLLKRWINTKIKMNFLPVSIQTAYTCCVWTGIVISLFSATEGNLNSLKTTYWEAFLKTNETIRLAENGSDCNLSTSICKLKEACGYDVFTSVTKQPNDRDYQMIVSLCYCLFSLIFDAYLKVIFLAIQYLHSVWRNQQRLLPFLRRIFTRRMQVSYVTAQLNVVSNLCLCTAFFLYFILRDIYPADKESADRMSSYVLLMDWSIVVGIGFRLFSIPYMGRILNVGSHFIISMWKLKRTLFQFLVMYTVVGSMFAVLFTYVAFDPKCPAKKIPPFYNYFTSVPATFRMMLGDNLLPSEMNDRLSVTYAVYVIVASVVMLSLFTGISGSVADRVLSPKLKGPLLLMEKLEESIHAETSLLLLLLPFRKTVQKWLLMREKRGTKLIKRDNETEFNSTFILEVEILGPETV